MITNYLLEKKLFILLLVLFPVLGNAQQFGSIDTSFNIGAGPQNLYGGGAESTVNSIKLAPDGNLIIGGVFLRYNNVDKQLLVKITEQGAVVPGFNLPTSNQLSYGNTLEQVYEVEPLENGKVLAKGYLSRSLGSTINNGSDRLFVLNSNGTLDAAFTINAFADRQNSTIEIAPNGKPIVYSYALKQLNPNGTVDVTFNTNLPQGYRVSVFKVLEDGKILVGGNLTTASGVEEHKIYRLLENGRIDSTFSLSARANGDITTLTSLGSRKIIIGGSFTSYNGLAVNKLVRLHSDGSFDNTFVATGSFGGEIKAIAELEDGSLLIGSSANQMDASALVKLDENGSINTSFTGRVKSYYGNYVFINDILQLPSGKIVIGGFFHSINGIRANNIGMINPDGSTDLAFNQIKTITPNISKVMKEPNTGKWIVAGSFDTFNGHITFGIARLLANGAVDTSFRHIPNHISSLYTYESINALAADGSGNIYFTAKGKPQVGVLPYNYTFNYSAALLPNGDLDENSRFSITPDRPGGVSATAIVNTTNNSLILAGSELSLFNITGNIFTSYSSGFATNGTIAVAQGDFNNMLLLGGDFTTAGGSPNNGLVRLTANREFDTSFSSAAGANGTVKVILPLQNGDYIVGGNFDYYAGIQRRGLAKVANSGAFIESFNANAGFQAPGVLPAELNAGLLLPNNLYLVAGNFTQFNGNVANRIVCLDENGNLVPSFQVTGADNTIHSIAQDAYGGILLSGDFTTFNGQPAFKLVKILGNGTVLSAQSKPKKLNIEVYPNPASIKLTIVSENGAAKVTLFDSQGKQVLSQEIEGTSSISTAKLSVGIYTLRLETTQGIAFQKVVKQ